jgi:hypothetical protein
VRFCATIAYSRHYAAKYTHLSTSHVCRGTGVGDLPEVVVSPQQDEHMWLCPVIRAFHLVETGRVSVHSRIPASVTIHLDRIDYSHAWNLGSNLDEVSKYGSSYKATLYVVAHSVADREPADCIVALGR